MKRKNKKVAWSSKWDHRLKMRGEKLKQIRLMFYRGIANYASLEDLGIGKSFTS